MKPKPAPNLVPLLSEPVTSETPACLAPGGAYALDPCDVGDHGAGEGEDVRSEAAPMAGTGKGWGGEGGEATGEGVGKGAVMPTARRRAFILVDWLTD